MSMQVINHRRLKGQGLLSLPSLPLENCVIGFNSKQHLFFDSCTEIEFSGFLAPHEGSQLGKRRVFIL